MKKLVRKASVALTVAATAVTGLTACASESSAPQSVAIIAGARQGVPAIFSSPEGSSGSRLELPSFASELTTRAEQDMSVTVIAADGKPRASQTMDLVVDHSSELDREDSIQANIRAAAGAVLKSQATTPESDLLTALDTAGRAGSGATDHTVLLVDSGLSTTGALLFQNGLIGPETEVSTIVDWLRSSGNLPTLQGVQVQWWGLGQTSSPQPAPPIWAMSTLEELWRAIIEASGGTVTFHGDPIPSAPPSGDLPAVSPVSFENSELPPINATIQDSDIGFHPDTAEFIDTTTARATLTELAQDLASGSHRELWVTGCTANPPVNDPQQLADLSEARAHAVAGVLVDLGVSTPLRVRGFGAACPGRLPEVGAEADVAAAQAHNRRVLITSRQIHPVTAH